MLLLALLLFLLLLLLLLLLLFLADKVFNGVNGVIQTKINTPNNLIQFVLSYQGFLYKYIKTENPGHTGITLNSRNTGQ